MACENMDNCRFFTDIMVNMPRSSDYIKDRYCLGREESCARYCVYKEIGKEQVPVRLFPFDTDRVVRIVKRLRR